MASVLLETISRNRLLLFSLVLLAFISGFFILGGTKGADPASANLHISNLFVKEKENRNREWFWYDASEGKGKNKDQFNKKRGWVSESIYDLFLNQNVTNSENLIFATKFPHPGDQMHNAFQFMLVVMNLQFEFYGEEFDEKHIDVEKKCKVVFSAKLGYSDDEKEGPNMKWTLMNSVKEEHRPVSCKFTQLRHRSGNRIEGFYTCEDQQLFELGSVAHKYYIVNLWFPKHDDNNLCLTGKGNHIISGLHFTEIHQNLGYTISLFVAKTVMFPLLLFALLFFVKRVKREEREFVLMEKSIVFLGTCLVILVFPIDWFTLSADMPYMLLVSDLRQGLFYAGLLQFWCIFAGEHILDQQDRNKIGAYKYEFICIAIGVTSMGIFDLVERGIQLTNPFHTIWRQDAGETAAKVFLVVSAIAAILFGLFFLRLIFIVLQVMRLKRNALSAMQQDRRLYYEGRIYRFKVALWVTVMVIVMTITCFVLDQINETSWKFIEDNSVNDYIIVSSALHFGMFGMWGTYVFAVLILYSPCGSSGGTTTVQYHRSDHLLQTADSNVDQEDESEIEFQHGKSI